MYGKPTPPILIQNFERNERLMFEESILRISELEELALHPADVKLLIESNFGSFFAVISAAYFHHLDFKEHMKMFVEHVRQHVVVHGQTAFNFIVKMFDDVQKLDKWVWLDYDSVYISPWCPDFSMEQKHRRLIQKIQEWPRDSPELVFDKILSMLLIILLVLSPPSHSRLQNEEGVEAMRLHYAHLLYRYLQSRFRGQAGSKFGKGIMIEAFAREAYEMHKKMLPV